MALIGSQASFFLDRYGKTSRCSECRKKIPAHSMSLVSRRYGKVYKRVCSESCRQDFDARYWDQVADEREEK